MRLKCCKRVAPVQLCALHRRKTYPEKVKGGGTLHKCDIFI